MNSKILVVAAHPDDEVLGCGGTVAKLAKKGCRVYTLILGEGITSRDDIRKRKKRDREIGQLRRQAKDANKILGVQEVFFFDFPDNRFDAVPLLDIVKVVEKIKNKIQPDIIFTHYGKDLNIDHQLSYKAVITATRPIVGETVKEIYSFEVPSSTEWNYVLSFSPDVFFDVSSTLELKLEAFSKYKIELREFPHPRSIKAIRLNAQNWGVKVGLNYTEAFALVRIIK